MTVLESLAHARNRLLEARRYVFKPSLHEAAEQYITEASNPLFNIEPALGEKDQHTLWRLQNNVAIGQQYILADPSVLDGYLYGAAFELSAMRRRLEREAEGAEAAAKESEVIA